MRLFFSRQYIDFVQKVSRNIARLWTYGLIFTIGIIPFFGSLGSYEITKIRWIQYVAIYCIIGLMITGITKKIQITVRDWIFLLWIVLLLISSMINPAPIAALAGWFGRGQGVMFFLAIWIVSCTYNTISVEQKKYGFMILAIFAIAQSFLVIFQYFQHSYFSSSKTWFGSLGTFGEVHTAATFLMTVFPLCVAGLFIQYPFMPVVGYGIGLIIGCAIIVTGSKIAIVSWILGMVVLIAYREIGKSQWIHWVLYGLVMVGIGLGYFGILTGTSAEPSPVENRRVLYQHAWSIIGQKPMLGYGAESEELPYERAFRSQRRELPLLRIDRAHSLLLDIALWTGVVGLFVWCVWFVVFLRSMPFFPGKVAGVLWFFAASFQPVGALGWLYLLVYGAVSDVFVTTRK